MKQIMIFLMFAVLVMASGCATQKACGNTSIAEMDITTLNNFLKIENVQIEKTPTPKGMVAFDTVAGFKEHVFKAIYSVELYEERKICCLWQDFSDQEQLNVKRFLLEEVVFNLQYLQDHESNAISYRTWDKRIIPCLRSLPHYKQELARLKAAGDTQK